MNRLKKNILPAIACIIIAGFASCGKDKGNDKPSGTILLSKLTVQNVGTTTTFTYDDQKRMIKAVSVFSNPKNNNTITFTYNGEGRLVEYVKDYTDPVYEDSKTVIIYLTPGYDFVGADIYSMSNLSVPRSSLDFEFSANKITRINYKADGITASGKTEITLAEGANNTSAIKLYKITSGVPTLLSTENYSDYDDKNSPDGFYPKEYKLLVSGILTSVNNYKNLKATDNLTEEVFTYYYTYEYNAEGYVTKRTSASGETITYEYIYQ